MHHRRLMLTWTATCLLVVAFSQFQDLQYREELNSKLILTKEQRRKPVKLKVSAWKSPQQRVSVSGWLYQANNDHILLAPDITYPEITLRIDVSDMYRIRYSTPKRRLTSAILGFAGGAAIGALTYREEICEVNSIFFRSGCTPNKTSRVGIAVLEGLMGGLIGFLLSNRNLLINRDPVKYFKYRLDKLDMLQ